MSCESTCSSVCWQRTLSQSYHPVSSSSSRLIPVYELQAKLASTHECKVHPLPDIIAQDVIMQILSELGTLFTYFNGTLVAANLSDIQQRDKNENDTSYFSRIQQVSNAHFNDIQDNSQVSYLLDKILLFKCTANIVLNLHLFQIA